jgi:lysophospholipase L1-like esterase
MNLQTNIKLQRQKFNLIDYNSNVLLLGSCFSENIGDKFEYFKFQSKVNPYGILFHPLAIKTLITRSINKTYYTEDELYFHNEQWCCLDAHSRLNKVSQHDLLSELNTQLDITNGELQKVTHIVITLGTAWVYRHIETDKIVANCHKIPQKKFLKELLSVKEITESLETVITLLRSVNPKVNILLTVSPVRHLKDGFIENNRSKSHLLTAMHHVVDFRNQIYYFPSYEIMNDELRDYRFYKTDMVHPNQLAVDYIWEKFSTVWLSDDALQTLNVVGNIQAKKAHKPFNPNSKAHHEFLAKLQSEIKDLQEKHLHIWF